MNSKGESNRSVRATRARLCGALVQMLAQMPVRQITVRELAQLADVSRGTFYFHFRDIYELLDYLEQQQLDQLDRFMDALLPRLQAPGEQPPKAVQALFEYLDRNDAICTALLGPNGDPAFSGRLQQVVADRYLRVLAPGGSTERQRYLAAFAVQGCFGVVERWLRQGKPQTAQEMAVVTWQGIRSIEQLMRPAAPAV